MRDTSPFDLGLTFRYSRLGKVMTLEREPEFSAELECSIVIPVYNEEEVIGPLLREIQQVDLGMAVEILVIDDGSNDHTADRVAEIFLEWPAGRLLQLTQNQGQAAALYYGMRRARGRVIVLLDGDGQNDPGDIPRFIAALGDTDMAAGRRVRRQDSWLRQCMSRLGNGVRRAILRDGISDSGCGIKAFHRRVMEAFIPIRTLYSFMPALAISAGFRVSEIPAQHRPRLAGKSKYGLRVFLWRPLLDLFGVWWFQHRRCAIPEFVAEKASSKVREGRPKGEDG